MHLRVLALAFALGVAAVGAALAYPPAPAAAQPAPTHFTYLPHVAQSYCGSFLDSFSDPSTGWFTGETGGLRAERIDGEYRLLIEGPGTIWLVAAPDCPRVAYRAAVDARWAGPPGNFYGLLFGIDDALGRSWLFAVNTDARVWLVFEIGNDSIDTLIAPATHDAIRPGGETNRLAAERTGDTITLSINGAPVGELPNAPAAAPVLAGVAAASYTTQSAADARFDNFLYQTTNDELRIKSVASLTD